MIFFIQKFKKLNEINTCTNEVVPEVSLNFTAFLITFRLTEEKYNYLYY